MRQLAPLAFVFALIAVGQQPVSPDDKCSIEGDVFNATNGEALKKARISLRQVGGGIGSVGASTDGSGHYTFTGIDPGKYVVVATHNGFLDQQYGSKAANRPGTVLTLVPGTKQKDVTFRLVQQGVIAGRILDEDGDPISNAMVQCMRYVYNRGHKQLVPSSAATSNDLGEYRIFGLAPGKYFVSATHRNLEIGQPAPNAQFEEGFATTYYPNSQTPESASGLDVTPGAQLRSIDIALAKTRTVRVRGHVVDVNNQIVSSARVSLIPRNLGSAPVLMGVLRRAAGGMDGKGNFEIRGVAAGSYVLLAEVGADKTQEAGRLPLEVGSTNIDGITVQLAGPPPDVAGRIIVEGTSDLQLASVNVFLEPKGSTAYGGSGGGTQQDGTFVLHSVAPDVYNVNVFGLTGNVYLKAVRFGDADVTDTGIDFSQGTAAGQVTVVLRAAGGQVSGTVQNDKQQPAAGAQVVLIPEEPKRGVTRLYRASPADTNGNFTMKGIPPGEYKLFAWELVEPNAWQDPEFLKPFESRGETVSIKENSTESKQLKALPAQE